MEYHDDISPAGILSSPSLAAALKYDFCQRHKSLYFCDLFYVLFTQNNIFKCYETENEFMFNSLLRFVVVFSCLRESNKTKRNERLKKGKKCAREIFKLNIIIAQLNAHNFDGKR